MLLDEVVVLSGEISLMYDETQDSFNGNFHNHQVKA